MPYKDKIKRMEHNRKYYLINKDKIIKRQKEYKEKNRDIVKEQQMRYHEKNKDERNKKRRIRWKEYYKDPNNRELERQRKRVYREENKEKSREYGKVYRDKNRDKIKERHKIWYQINKNEINRKVVINRNSDIFLKFRFNISALIREKLKRRLLTKNGKSTFSFLPYTIDDLIYHLKKQFKLGMSWKNYGKWHVDHIIPDCKFNYTSVDDEEFQECWALENLQPLWAAENMRKNRFIIIN